MRKASNTVCMIALAFGAMPVNAATFDGGKSLICASQTVNECVVDKQCNHVTPASINLPDFFNVDVKSKLIRGPAVFEKAVGTSIPPTRSDLPQP